MSGVGVAMRCPWCDLEGAPRALHAHLADEHADAVRFEERANGPTYAIECPTCGSAYEQRIKPGGRDPAFVDEHDREIRLVAFDMLVNHLIAEHPET